MSNYINESDLFYAENGILFKRRWSKHFVGDEIYKDFNTDGVITTASIKLAEDEAKELNDEYDDLCLKLKGIE